MILRAESGGIARDRSTTTQRKPSGFEDDRRSPARAHASAQTLTARTSW